MTDKFAFERAWSLLKAYELVSDNEFIESPKQFAEQVQNHLDNLEDLNFDLRHGPNKIGEFRLEMPGMSGYDTIEGAIEDTPLIDADGPEEVKNILWDLMREKGNYWSELQDLDIQTYPIIHANVDRKYQGQGIYSQMVLPTLANLAAPFGGIKSDRRTRSSKADNAHRRSWFNSQKDPTYNINRVTAYDNMNSEQIADEAYDYLSLDEQEVLQWAKDNNVRDDFLKDRLAMWIRGANGDAGLREYDVYSVPDPQTIKRPFFGGLAPSPRLLPDRHSSFQVPHTALHWSNLVTFDIHC